MARKSGRKDGLLMGDRKSYILQKETEREAGGGHSEEEALLLMLNVEVCLQLIIKQTSKNGNDRL